MGGSDTGWHRAGVTGNACHAEEEMEPGKVLLPTRGTTAQKGWASVGHGTRGPSPAHTASARRWF